MLFERKIAFFSIKKYLYQSKIGCRNRVLLTARAAYRLSENASLMGSIIGQDGRRRVRVELEKPADGGKNRKYGVNLVPFYYGQWGRVRCGTLLQP